MMQQSHLMAWQAYAAWPKLSQIEQGLRLSRGVAAIFADAVLIGSIRRECLDHLLVLGEAHLRRIVTAYVSYYNELRTHLSLNKDAPIHRPIHRIGRIIPLPILGGLHHQYCRT
jgi:hypothetical protein